VSDVSRCAGDFARVLIANEPDLPERQITWPQYGMQHDLTKAGVLAMRRRAIVCIASKRIDAVPSFRNSTESAIRNRTVIKPSQNH
jgi:hypothetical protein